MLKNWLHDIALAIQAKSGVSLGLVVWAGIIAFASLTAFAFLCVAAYVWVTLQLGPIYAGLVLAGVFVLIALIAALTFSISRRRAKERAILERAARAHGASSWLLDPKIVGVAMQAGRALGWERIIPVALLGLLAAQWARERKSSDSEAS